MRASKIRGLVLVQVYGQASFFLLQFGSVPIFLKVWGAETYGLWLTLMAIPLILSQINIGFGAAAGPIVVSHLNRDDLPAARSTLWAAFLANATISFGIAVVAYTLISLFSETIASSTVLSGSDVKWILLIGVALSLLWLMSSDIYVVYYASDWQALGEFFLCTIHVVEGSLALVALVGFHIAPIDLACLLLLSRVSLMTVMWCVSLALSHSLWRVQGISLRSLASAYRALRQPAVGFFLDPLVLIFQNQALVLLVGTVVGPTAAAIVHTHRLVARITWQITGAVRAITSGEIMRVAASGQRGRLINSCQFVLGLYLTVSLTVFVGLCCLGPLLMTVWLGGRVRYDPFLFYTFATASCFSGMLFGVRSILQSMNLHYGLSLREFVFASCGLLLSGLVLFLGGPLGSIGTILLLVSLLSFVCAANVYAAEIHNEYEKGVGLVFGAIGLAFVTVRRMAART